MSLFSEPKKVIDQCSIQAGQTIADFGAGSGMYTIEAAKSLMSTGKVYAIDVQDELLVRLQKETLKEHLSNVDIIHGDVEKPGGTRLGDSMIDLVLISNLLFQVEDKKGMLIEAKRVLVPGGRVMVVEWSESFGGIGPHTDHVVTSEMCLELFERAGFAKDREVSAGSHHYGFIFKKM